VHLATFWPLADDQAFAYAAFRIFRDYDGRGSRFGDTAIATHVSDPSSIRNFVGTSAYASTDTTGKVVLVLINKHLSAAPTMIELAHGQARGRATVYTLTQAGGPHPRLAGMLRQTAANRYRYRMPAQSVSVIALPGPGVDGPARERRRVRNRR
jgi:hypothetical protein